MKRIIKNIDFFEALRIAVTKNLFEISYKGTSLILNDKYEYSWIPSVEQMQNRKWNVVVEDEVFVWGVCDPETGHSHLFREKPVLKNHNGEVWESTMEDEFDCDRIYLYFKNIFPKNTPVKLKLVPVVEDEN